MSSSAFPLSTVLDVVALARRRAVPDLRAARAGASVTASTWAWRAYLDELLDRSVAPETGRFSRRRFVSALDRADAVLREMLTTERYQRLRALRNAVRAATGTDPDPERATASLGGVVRIGEAPATPEAGITLTRAELQALLGTVDGLWLLTDAVRARPGTHGGAMTAAALSIGLGARRGA